jgi:branched-chain amino acid transport system ATP-binding protein
MLIIDDLHVAYDDMEVVHGVSLEVPDGGAVGLLGANGAGKTSMLRAIAGLIKSKGRIIVNGQEMRGKSSTHMVRAGVVLVPEGRELCPSLTVRENLLLGGTLHRSRSQLNAALDEVVAQMPILKDRLSAPASRLSGGQQQMLTLGRALMAKPQLLLLDEPSMGLQPNLVIRVYELLAEISKAGTAVLVAEQNVTAALGIVTRGYVLENGKIALQDDTEGLRTNPAVVGAFLGRAATDRKADGAADIAALPGFPAP